jgi:hypothetical protein
MLNLKDIQIRDPFVLPAEEEKTYYMYGYYMYGTTDKDPWGVGISFEAYKSKDLKLWDCPFTVFTPPPDFWADRNFWAPEVHLLCSGRVSGIIYMRSVWPIQVPVK